MKISLSELILLINRTESEIQEKQNIIYKNIIITKDVEIDNGFETLLTDVEPFDTIYNSYIESLTRLETYRNALTKANCNTKIVDNDLTIIEALNKINNLRKQLSLYDNLSVKRSSKDRRFDGNGSTSYYRCNELNFKMESIEQLRKATSSQIDKLESLITSTNASTLVEI